MTDHKVEATYHSGETPLAPADGRPWESPGRPPWVAAEPVTREARTILVPIVVIGIVLGLLVAAGLLWAKNALPVGVPIIGKDTGIAACEAIANKSGKPVPAGETGRSTADQYQTMRGVFADSRYAEIRDPGVRFIDLLRQVDGMGKDAGLGALAFLGPLTESYAALSGGCAAHGYTLPALGE